MTVLSAEERALCDRYSIRWHDDDHTMLVCEPPGDWNWEDAYTILTLMNKFCDTVNHGVYTVFHHRMTRAAILPKGNAIPHIRRLMNITHPNDQLIIFVGANTFARRMMDMTGRLYGFRALISDFRFVNTLDEAEEVIAEHKQQSQLS